MFDSYKPYLGDKDRYIEELSGKLDSVEMIHDAFEENARRTRRSVLIAVLAGMLLGGLVMAIILLFPSSALGFSIELGVRVLSFSLRHSLIVLSFVILVPLYLYIALTSIRQN